MDNKAINNYPHRRKNILTGEWVLVSPNRAKRPWQGEITAATVDERLRYDPECYLCPGNTRANGEVNPDYKSTFVFTNDFPSLREDIPSVKENKKNLLIAETQKGVCRVLNFSPRHDLTLAEMETSDIEIIISAWQDEFKTLSRRPNIKHIQIFENKGAIMGNSNPHPHCQIWAQESIPNEPKKELINFKKYYEKNKRSLLADYLKLELRLNERIVFSNEKFAALVPYWAVWPFETLIIPKRKMPDLLSLSAKEKSAMAEILSAVTVKYDNLFRTSFPYSFGIHQAPTDGKEHKEWHMHMHFYPPLLRSAGIKKFMVGYEMMAEPQRDITPEYSAERLRELPVKHFKR